MKRTSIVVILAIANAALSQNTAKPRLDTFGDPLPAQALHRFGTSRFCTDTEVTSLVLSHDAKLLAAADREGRVYVWDADTGKEVLRTEPGQGKRVIVSPDGQWLASGEEGAVEIRNLRKLNAAPISIGAATSAFSFAPDGTAIAIAPAAPPDGDETEVPIHEVPGGKVIHTLAKLDFRFNITSIAFSRDGKHVAAAGVPMVDMDKAFIRVVVWDAKKGTVLKQIDHAGKEVHDVFFLPDHKTLIAQVGTSLVAWTMPSGDRLEKFGHTVGTAFALDATCKTIATTDGPKVIAFDSGKELHEFEAPTLLRNPAMSGNGKLLAASAARLASASPRIMLWDLTTGKERTLTDVHRHYVEAVAYSHDGKTIATASHVEGVARVWDAKSAKLLHTLNLDSLAAKKSGGPRARRSLIDGLAFPVDRPELFVGGQRWDLTKASPIPLQADDDFTFDQGNSHRAVLTTDARLGASFLHDGSLMFWDPAKAQELKRIAAAELKKNDGNWPTLAFTPNHKLAALGRWFPPLAPQEDGVIQDTIQILDIAAAKRVKSMRPSPSPVVRLMFAPDGETLAVIGYPNRLELWHQPTGRLLREMYLSEIDDMPRPFVMPPVAFAPHGQWIAFTHQPGEIVLIETMTGKEIQTLHGHHGHISSVAFSPDSRRLLSGGRDTTALLWSTFPSAERNLPANWKDADKLWLDLGGQADQVYPIVWALIAHPDRAVEVLTKRLQPDGGATDKEIRELIKNLSSAKFAQRDVAIRRLKLIGVRSLPALEQSLKDAPDLETGRRIRELLKTVETSLTPESLRDIRGLLVLEMIATPGARALLTEITRGDAAAGKTRMAHAALQRLSAVK